MTAPGQPTVLRNAMNREIFVFAETPDDRESTAFRVILDAGGSGGGNALVHVHPLADETFSVITGRLKVTLAGAEHVVPAGERFTIPRGSPHFFRNGHDGATEAEVRFTPAQRHRDFFMTFARIAESRPDWFSAKGDPHLLLIALFLHGFRDHLYLAGPPVALQKLLFAALAPIARWRGYAVGVPGGTRRTD